LGSDIGALTKGATGLVGEITGFDSIRKIGEAAARVTQHTGETLGNLADGVVAIGSGILNQDRAQGIGGAEKIVNTTADTVKGMAKGVVSTAKTAGTVVSGVYEKNERKVVGGLKTLGTAVAIGALSIGVLEIADTIYEADVLMDDGTDEFVSPHWVNEYTRSDGTFVSGHWRDGDGNPGINLSLEDGGGYYRG
jgi:hypothetical protein